VALECLDSKLVKQMFIAGAKYLESKKAYVDELNVFPVPDGDTGTNMSLTIMAAAREVQNADQDSMAQIAKAISGGSLRGARGNSGVILSQLLRGFAKEIGEYEKLDTVILASAIQRGVETAYKAVMKPKEGTILTVARAMAEKAAEIAEESDDIVFLLAETLDYAIEVLDKTPDMLPVLKEAGVVDAGGQGLVYVLHGAYIALQNGGEIPQELIGQIEIEAISKTVKKEISTDDIKFGYCTEFIIDLENTRVKNSEKEALKLRDYLETIGDSIVSVADEEVIKIHVHTNDPGLALQKALMVGSLTNIKIDNMREQHSEIIGAEQTKTIEKKDVGFIAISIGEGLSEIFNSLGVDYIVEGGQTMNPSTEDILLAADKVNADNVFIFPNNKNIILAAMQAKDLVEGKTLHVIPTKSIPQGIATLINYNQELSVEENTEAMNNCLTDISSGQVTYAVRDTSINDKAISQGDYLGIGNDEILAVEKDVEICVRELLKQLITEDSGLVTIYYGQDIDEDKAKLLAEYIEQEYEDCEVEVHYGGQPLYYYLLSVE